MERQEIIDEHIAIERNAAGITISVIDVEWDGHTPVERHLPARKLSTDASPEELSKAIDEVLSDKKFFRVCNDCRELNVVGHIIELHGKTLCHGCAQMNHGIIF